MSSYNELNELPIAQLSDQQLEVLQNAERSLNEQNQDVYLIAFRKQKS